MKKLWIRQVKWLCQGHTTFTEGTGFESCQTSKPMYAVFMLLVKETRKKNNRRPIKKAIVKKKKENKYRERKDTIYR